MRNEVNNETGETIKESNECTSRSIPVLLFSRLLGALHRKE